MKLAVCLPSRGIIHSRTMEAVLKNVGIMGQHQWILGSDWDYFPSHDKPIPEAQIYCIEQALAREPEFIWMVEEDVVPVPHCLDVLFAELEWRTGIGGATAWYRMAGGLPSYEMAGRSVLFSGIGCILLRADVFSRIEKPWFSVEFEYDHQFRITGRNPESFGKQDVHFYAQMTKANIEVGLVDSECHHLFVEKWGQPRVNSGCHVISIR